MSSRQMPEAGTLLRMPIITLATIEENQHSLMIEEMLTEGGEITSNFIKNSLLYNDTLMSSL